MASSILEKDYFMQYSTTFYVISNRKIITMKIRLLLMIAAAGLFVGCKCVVCDSYDYTSSVLPNDSSTAMPVKVSIKSSSDLNGPVRMVREYN